MKSIRPLRPRAYTANYYRIRINGKKEESEVVLKDKITANDKKLKSVPSSLDELQSDSLYVSAHQGKCCLGLLLTPQLRPET